MFQRARALTAHGTQARCAFSRCTEAGEYTWEFAEQLVEAMCAGAREQGAVMGGEEAEATAQGRDLVTDSPRQTDATDRSREAKGGQSNANGGPKEVIGITRATTWNKVFI